MPQVSVIIPTHNRAGFLSRAMHSVLNQTFKDVELVVVDDASSDHTREVVESFRDARVRWLRHDAQHGGAAARNTGILNSAGEYVAFLDDDDEWYPHKLTQQVALMRKSQPEVAVVYAGYVIIDESDGTIRGQKVPTRKGNLYTDLLARNCVGGTSSVLLRRSCLQQVGLFDEKLPSFQDYDLWIRIARIFRFDCIAEPLLTYFVHPHKVWTNLDALTTGLEIMARKYGQFPAFKRRCSTYSLSLGVRFGEARRIDKARKALLRAIAWHPYKMQPYLYFSLALLGLRPFLAVINAKARVSARSVAGNL